jgi:hypothetical protein
MGQKNTRETLIEELGSLRDSLIDGPEIQQDILIEESVGQCPPQETTAANAETPILGDRCGDAMSEAVSPAPATPETTTSEPSALEPSTLEPSTLELSRSELSTSESSPHQTHLFDNTDFDHSGA